MKKTIIYLVRHGESTHNQNARISGDSDPLLTPKGRQQLLNTKNELKGVVFDKVYSSPLTRAVHSAEILADQKLNEENKHPNFRERNFGSLEGRPQHMLNEARDKLSDKSDEANWNLKAVPDMESDSEIAARVIPALEKIAKENKRKTILVVSHGGAMRTTAIKLTGHSYKELPVDLFKNAGYIELEYGEDGFKVIQISGVKL